MSYADNRRNRVNAGHMHSVTEVKSEQPGGKFCERTGEMENARLSHLWVVSFTSFAVNFSSTPDDVQLRPTSSRFFPRHPSIAVIRAIFLRASDARSENDKHSREFTSHECFFRFNEERWFH